MGPDGPKWDQEDFFPTDPDLADILGRMDLDFENFYFFDFLDPRFLDFQVPRFSNFWISRPQISKFPDLQVPRFPDSGAGAAAAGRTLRPQPDPSPNAPRDQIRRKGPCCDKGGSLWVVFCTVLIIRAVFVWLRAVATDRPDRYLSYA